MNFTISFPAIHQYSLFQVNDDQGVLLVYTSFILIMTGLLTKLYLRPFLERRQRKRSKPITLDRRWSSDVERRASAGSGSRPRTRRGLTGLGRQLGDPGGGEVGELLAASSPT